MLSGANLSKPWFGHFLSKDLNLSQASHSGSSFA